MDERMERTSRLWTCFKQASDHDHVESNLIESCTASRAHHQRP